MSSFETLDQDSLTPKEAFPNPIHRAVYRVLCMRSAWMTDRRAQQEADAQKALRMMPGVVYTSYDEMDINRIRFQRRQELRDTAACQIEEFMVEHHLGSIAFQNAVSKRLESGTPH